MNEEDSFNVTRRGLLELSVTGAVGLGTLRGLATPARGTTQSGYASSAPRSAEPLSSTPTQQARLIADDADRSDFFGSSVALDGDTALIGALDSNRNGKNAGAVYAFERTDGSWTQRAKLIADDGDRSDFFGSSVALEGDTALIGAVSGDPNGVVAGAAYVFERVDGAWIQRARLLADDGESGDAFGNSVALDGDTALVGASDSSQDGDDVGGAYVFERTDDSWTQQAKLAADDGESGDDFGWSVDLAGDTALIGAPHDINENGDSAGGAYVFERAGGSWTQQVKLTDDDGEIDEDFGASVALDGDTALVGATKDDNGDGEFAGAAYVFDGTNGAWTQRAKLTADDGSTGDAFGWSVDLAGDTALIGASDSNQNGFNAGAAYVFDGTDDSWTQRARLLADDGESGDAFGHSVALDGDTALIGAHLDENQNGNFVGEAYVFTGVEGTEALPPVVGDSPPQDPDGDGLYEDVNGDGSVTPGDATVLFKAVFGNNPVVMNNPEKFDFNGDGDVTTGDAMVLFNEIF